jgi:nitrate/nitrite-specific signal transduction histidine kinase
MQFRFARSALIVSVFTTLVSIGLLLWVFWAFNIWQGQRLPFVVQVSLVFALLFNLMGVFFVSIFNMHRVVGPMFNLLRQFSQVSRGDFSAMARFRDGDEMHYVARRFNEMVMMLRVRNDFIYGRIEEAKRDFEAGNMEAAKAALQAALDMRARELDAGSARDH